MGMPDSIGVSYNINYKPNPLTLDLAASVTGTKATVTLTALPPDFSVSFIPNMDNGVTDAMMSAVLTPLALVMNSTIENKIREEVKNKELFSHEIPPVPINIEGIQLTLTPQNVKLGSDQGNLKITGEVSIK